MAYYHVCPDCGGNLDPGEKCDCQKEKERKQKRTSKLYRQETRSGQFVFDWSAGKVKA